MAIVATDLPAETDLLCEACGYRLNELDQSSNCPECGQPIQQSLGDHRHPSSFESNPSVQTFVETSVALLLHPTQFFTTLTTRQSSNALKQFSRLHSLLASVLYTLAAYGHARWIVQISNRRNLPTIWSPIFILCAFLVIYPAIAGLTRLASWLSAVEAKYWGMRLPHSVVTRGLQFHTAHYLLPGLVANIVVWGYQFLLYRGAVSHIRDPIYLYSLCGVVIVAAIYLFQTYWIAMRSMKYANR